MINKKIIFKRESPFYGFTSTTKVRILINGEEKAIIKKGETIEIPVSLGENFIQVSNKFAGSKLYKVDIKEDEEYIYEISYFKGYKLYDMIWNIESVIFAIAIPFFIKPLFIVGLIVLAFLMLTLLYFRNYKKEDFIFIKALENKIVLENTSLNIFNN